MSKKIISLIIPCFNEEEVIKETFKRLNNIFLKLAEFNFELIFVDDGSVDKTRQILREFSERDSRVKVLGFSRNFGHQMAVSAGIDMASGDAAVLIDADLQDPPEVIERMIEKWKQGFDVVYGTRISRSGESAFKLITAKIFYRLLNYLSEVVIPLDTGDFRLISRNVINSIKSMPERDRFVRGMVSWVGFKQISIPYERAERFAGESKYPLLKMVRFAADGLISFSTKPLRISIAIGVICAGLSMLGIVYVVYLRLFTDLWAPGWAALMISILFIGGIQLICLGILGEYVGRIYNQSKNRPLYIISEYINF